jgi:hypothetical protein
MPKVPTFTLAWSPARAAYELYQTRSREMLGIVPDGPAWFVWLEQVSSFAFSGKRGHYTARKEAKQRGDRYWSAYLATGQSAQSLAGDQALCAAPTNTPGAPRSLDRAAPAGCGACAHARLGTRRVWQNNGARDSLN